MSHFPSSIFMERVRSLMTLDTKGFVRERAASSAVCISMNWSVSSALTLRRSTRLR